MKRFIDIGDQMAPYLGEPKQFCFYCTVYSKFETFSEENLWYNATEFKKDYIESGGDELERYLSLIPEEFK